MRQTTLGRTGLRVRRLGFGGIPIQRVTESEAVETVVHAVNCGVDFIDTARGYTTSEQRIGTALKAVDQRVTVASKSPSRTADALRKDIDTSLRNLQLDTVDLYQCHFVKNAEDYRRVVATDGALVGLQKAREEGLIRHIGVTTHSLDLAERILDDDLFETIMICYSFLEPAAAERVIPRALSQNVGVIAMKPFSGGALDNAAAALKFVLAQPEVVVIPGVENRRLFDQNWAVFMGDWTLSAADSDDIETVRRRYDRRFCRRCDYCQPCSEEIPIQLILGIRYALKRFGSGFSQQGWVKDAVEKARRCSACGDCLERCPYELPIPDLIRENLAYLDERG
jgi:predicted aldo/keto reductase-like oxidoreductase